MSAQWSGLNLSDEDVLAMLLHANQKLNAAMALLESLRAAPGAAAATRDTFDRALQVAQTLVESAHTDLAGSLARSSPPPKYPEDIAV